MAARLRKTHQDEYKFYVYEILDDDGKVIYVGKGSKSRMAVSLRHKKGNKAREVARFKNEEDAYDFEISHIAEKLPTMNKHLGGNGSRVGCIKGCKLDRDTKLMKKIGVRAFAARMLIDYYKTFKYITSKIDSESIFMYTPEVVKALSAIDIKKMYEVGYGSGAVRNSP